jgi:hypothetical protein
VWRAGNWSADDEMMVKMLMDENVTALWNAVWEAGNWSADDVMIVKWVMDENVTKIKDDVAKISMGNETAVQEYLLEYIQNHVEEFRGEPGQNGAPGVNGTLESNNALGETVEASTTNALLPLVITSFTMSALMFLYTIYLFIKGCKNNDRDKFLDEMYADRDMYAERP